MFIEGFAGESFEAVWMMVGNFGRIDHLFGQLNSLYRFRKWPVYVCSQTWISFLVPEERSTKFTVDMSLLGNSVGLLPLGAPANIWTTGLKWNLGIFHDFCCSILCLFSRRRMQVRRTCQYIKYIRFSGDDGN